MRRRRAARAWGALLLVAGLAAPAPRPARAQADEPAVPPRYEITYEARLLPSERAARVRIRLGQGAENLLWLRFRIDPQRHSDFQASNGTLTVAEDVVEWEPAGPGSSLRYVFRIDQVRDERSYDARFAENWALFRGGDLVPPARVRTDHRAESAARLVLRLPERWSAVAPYERAGRGVFVIENAERRFDRPTGWILAGRLGVKRETVAGTKLAIAAPIGQRFRRLDVLALLRWTLPELRDVLGELPDRLLVVGANDPMWRGGLSAPRSVYLHAGRPLIESDGTSPVLHELAHSLLGIRAEPGHDWIVEGLAEYYSLEALVRSRTVSRRRHEKSLARLAERGREAPSLVTESARGAVTARAVTVLEDLDRAIREASGGEHDLDDAVRALAEANEPVTAWRLRAAAERFTGAQGLAAFFRRHLPGVSTAPPPEAKSDA